jgi:hypothetical protein
MAMLWLPVCVHGGWGASPAQTFETSGLAAPWSGWMSRYSRSSLPSSSGLRSMVRPSGSLSTVPPSVYQNFPSAGKPSRPAASYLARSADRSSSLGGKPMALEPEAMDASAWTRKADESAVLSRVTS